MSGRYDNVMLTFIDEAADVLRVTRRGRKDDVFEVDVGYDFSQNYSPNDDALVIQLLETKLKQVVENDEGFASKRKELLRTITDWTTEAIGA